MLPCWPADKSSSLWDTQQDLQKCTSPNHPPPVAFLFSWHYCVTIQNTLFLLKFFGLFAPTSWINALHYVCQHALQLTGVGSISHVLQLTGLGSISHALQLIGYISLWSNSHMRETVLLVAVLHLIVGHHNRTCFLGLGHNSWSFSLAEVGNSMEIENYLEVLLLMKCWKATSS